jgi:hypothetical protein
VAFGGLRGTLVGGNNSIPASFATTAGSIAVSVGDLIIVVVGQQTTLTFGGTSGGGGTTVPTDNLGNTYVFQNNGTDAGAATGRMAYSRVTVAGTLTTVTCTCIGSTNDGSLSVAVIEGPFVTSPIDANPANVSNDTTTPYTGPATGTLSQADEFIVSWYAKDGNSTFAGSAPNTLLHNQNQSTNIVTGIGGYVVSATTTQSPAWTGTAPTVDVLGTASFKKDLTQAVTAPLYTNSSTFHAPTVTPGAVNADVALFANSNTFFAETVASIYPLTAPLFTNDSVFFEITADYDASTNVDAPLFVNAQTFYDPFAFATYQLLPALMSETTFFSVTIDTYLGIDVPALQEISVFYSPVVVYTPNIAPPLLNLTTFHSPTVRNQYHHVRLTVEAA